MLCPSFSLGHTNRQNLLYRITQEITGRPHEGQWSIIPVHNHTHAVFIICAPSLAMTNECKYVCGCPGSNKSSSPRCEFTEFTEPKNDPRLGYCRLDVIRRNKAIQPLRALPADLSAPISSYDVDTFSQWMGQQYKVDRARRINTEELIKASQQAHLDRSEELLERVRRIQVVRTERVTKEVAVLSGTRWYYLLTNCSPCIELLMFIL
jgi:hypothetical protein